MSIEAEKPLSPAYSALPHVKVELGVCVSHLYGFHKVRRELRTSSESSLWSYITDFIIQGGVRGSEEGRAAAPRTRDPLRSGYEI